MFWEKYYLKYYTCFISKRIHIRVFDVIVKCGIFDFEQLVTKTHVA